MKRLLEEGMSLDVNGRQVEKGKLNVQRRRIP